MDLYRKFLNLPLADSNSEFRAIRLSARRPDFLAKSQDGNPVFLLHDASPETYIPSIALQNVSVQFHCTCRVVTGEGVVEEQFAVVRCESPAQELHELFINSFAATVALLPDLANSNDLSERIRGLLELFRSLSRPSNKEVTGLWAELFIIKSSGNASKSLAAWHADPLERFDFTWPTGLLEVKATVKEIRAHDFAVEQLQPPANGLGYVASLLLQPISGGEGIVDLARAIEAELVNEPALRQKLWENILGALGSEFTERLDRRYDVTYAQRNLVVFSMSDVPSVMQPSDTRITGIRFRSDLSSVASSLSGKPMDVLGRLFS